MNFRICFLCSLPFSQFPIAVRTVATPFDGRTNALTDLQARKAGAFQITLNGASRLPNESGPFVRLSDGEPTLSVSCRLRQMQIAFWFAVNPLSTILFSDYIGDHAHR